MNSSTSTEHSACACLPPNNHTYPQTKPSQWTRSSTALNTTTPSSTYPILGHRRHPSLLPISEYDNGSMQSKLEPPHDRPTPHKIHKDYTQPHIGKRTANPPTRPRGWNRGRAQPRGPWYNPPSPRTTPPYAPYSTHPPLHWSAAPHWYTTPAQVVYPRDAQLHSEQPKHSTPLRTVLKTDQIRCTPSTPTSRMTTKVRTISSNQVPVPCTSPKPHPKWAPQNPLSLTPRHLPCRPRHIMAPCRSRSAGCRNMSGKNNKNRTLTLPAIENPAIR